MNRRKGLSTKTSPNDQSLIKYVYYNYDPEEIETLRFKFSLKSTYLKGAKAGEISHKTSHNPNSSECLPSNNLTKNEENHSVIKFFDTGSVQSISSSLQKITQNEEEYYAVKKSIQKKPFLQLFQMKLCEHIPEDDKLKRLLEQQVKSQENKSSKNRKIQKVDPIYCKKCDQRLFYFYLPEQKSVTYAEIQKQLQIQEPQEQIKNIQWTVMLGETFTKTTQIAKYNDKQYFLEQNGKISHLIAWYSLQQWPQKETQVLRYRPIYCQHEKIQYNICQYCFQEVDPVELNFKKFLFQMQEKDDFKREMITTGSTLVQQQNKFVDELLKRQRGILILDLDNTVLHSIELGQIHESRLNEMEEFYQLMIGHLIFNKFIVTSCFVVKMRPYFKDFIQTAVNYYDIYVYTKGTRNYAQEICDAIRNQYASRNQFTNNRNENLEYFQFLNDKNAFTPNRIITRDEDPDLQKKSLNNILPTRQDNLMVMDDLSSVWNYSAAVLYTVPFHYFFKKKILDAERLYKSQNLVKRSNHKALDESKEGQKLKPVQDLYVENVQPVRELPCDHFEREVIEIQNQLIEPANDLPCDILEKQILQIERRELMVSSSHESNGEIKQNIVAVDAIEREQSQPNLIEITKGIAPEDKQYEYDILPRNDFYLIYASHSLMEIHKRFFIEKKLQKSTDKKISFAQMNRKLKLQILDGTLIKFCMKNQNKIDIYGRAMKLGCKILPPSDTNTHPQYLIRLNSIKSNVPRMYFKKEEEEERKTTFKQQAEIEGQTRKQLKYYAQKLKVSIVSESWIDFCYSFTYKFPVEPFIIDSDDIFKDIHEEQFEWIIEQKAKQLLGNIRKNNSEIEKSNREAKQKCMNNQV